MSRATPVFPAFDEWQKLTESEQDALLDQFESAQRRSSLVSRGFAALACTAGLAVGVVLLVF